jgi:hypothetical protein
MKKKFFNKLKYRGGWTSQRREMSIWKLS